MFQDWLKLSVILRDNGYSTNNLICPECKNMCIDYAYIGDSKTRIGYMCMWCNNCNRGIHISRVKIPDSVKYFEFNNDIENIIPNFTEIYSKK